MIIYLDHLKHLHNGNLYFDFYYFIRLVSLISIRIDASQLMYLF